MAEKRVFTVLENNPETVNQLAHSLGLSPKFAFHDIYSLTDADLIAFIPRPVYALLVIIPLSPSWNQARTTEDSGMEWYSKSGPDEPVIWFKQTITHGCGSVGMLHCAFNSGPVEVEPAMILPGSELEKLRKDAIPLKLADRAELLAQSDALYEAHQAAAENGDTIAPDCEAAHRLGQHFVAFVKGKDGHLYELEGSRKGPLDRGLLGDDEDLLSEKAISLGLGRLIEIEKAAQGDLRFSCVALAPALED